MSVWNDYLSTFPASVQKRLRQMRTVLKDTVPAASDTVSYGMPALAIGGKALLGFGAFKSHIGFYPGAAALKAFADDLKQYKTSKGSVQFPIDKPLPVDLVKRIARFKFESLK